MCQRAETPWNNPLPMGDRSCKINACPFCLSVHQVTGSETDFPGLFRSPTSRNHVPPSSAPLFCLFFPLIFTPSLFTTALCGHIIHEPPLTGPCHRPSEGASWLTRDSVLTWSNRSGFQVPVSPAVQHRCTEMDWGCGWHSAMTVCEGWGCVWVWCWTWKVRWSNSPLSQTPAGDEPLCFSGSLVLPPKTPLLPAATGTLREFHGDESSPVLTDFARPKLAGHRWLELINVSCLKCRLWANWRLHVSIPTALAWEWTLDTPSGVALSLSIMSLWNTEVSGCSHEGSGSKGDVGVGKV